MAITSHEHRLLISDKHDNDVFKIEENGNIHYMVDGKMKQCRNSKALAKAFVAALFMLVQIARENQNITTNQD
jgi:hypothetical protein